MSTKKNPAKKPEKIPAKKPGENKQSANAVKDKSLEIVDALKDRKPIDAIVICTACAEFEKRCKAAMLNTFADEVARTFESVERIVDRNEKNNVKMTMCMLTKSAHKIAETIYRTLKDAEIGCTAIKTDDDGKVLAKETFRPSQLGKKPEDPEGK